MESQSTAQAQDNKYFRFQVFQGEKKEGGKVAKTKSVGMAYLRDGQNIFTLRLWMFSSERYYLIPNKHDSSKFFVMTREPNKSPQAKNKYFWNIVGNGKADSVLGVIEMAFDLLEKPIYMNIFPESSAFSVTLANPEEVMDAA
jgi:hypothetical protein